MRKNIFQLLQGNDLDLTKEYNILYELFEKTPFGGTKSMCDYINLFEFKNWKYRSRYINIKNMMNDLCISNFDMVTLGRLNLENLLIYMEFIINVMALIDENILDYHDEETLETLNVNITELLEDLNYEVYYEDNSRYIIIEKDKLSTAIAETLPNITSPVIEYRRFSLKGDLESKRTILKKLSDKIEPLTNKFKGTEFKSFIEDIGTLLNNLNIRHNNLEGKSKQQYIVDMKEAELEEWYDKTYDMILVALLIDRYINDKSKIKELKEHLK